MTIKELIRVVSVHCSCSPKGFTPLTVTADGKGDWMPQWNKGRGFNHIRKHPDHSIEICEYWKDANDTV